jgi:hypothetical protein
MYKSYEQHELAKRVREKVTDRLQREYGQIEDRILSDVVNIIRKEQEEVFKDYKTSIAAKESDTRHSELSQTASPATHRFDNLESVVAPPPFLDHEATEAAILNFDKVADTTGNPSTVSLQQLQSSDSGYSSLGDFRGPRHEEVVARMHAPGQHTQDPNSSQAEQPWFELPFDPFLFSMSLDQDAQYKCSQENDDLYALE